MTTETLPPPGSSTAATAGKYLTFVLSEEVYGVEILRVREIIGMMDITEVPKTPDFIRGVINLRGKIIPVVDLRRKFGMTPGETTKNSCIVVADITSDGSFVQMGALVDQVCEVIDIAGDDIAPAPAFGEDVDCAFIRGIAKHRGEVKILLDIDRVVSRGDLKTNDTGDGSA